MLGQVPTGVDQLARPIATNLNTGISRQDAEPPSTPAAGSQSAFEPRNTPDPKTSCLGVSLKRTTVPPSHRPIPAPIKRSKQGLGNARIRADTVAGTPTKAKQEKRKAVAPQPRGQRPGKFSEDVTVREKTIGEGSLAKVGDIVKVHHQFRDRNHTIFFSQLEGEPVSSVPTNNIHLVN